MGQNGTREAKCIKMINALTVDLEDWYHVCGNGGYAIPSKWKEYENRVAKNTQKVLEILESYHVKATFFVLGYIAEKEPEIVKTIAKEGHEIATHGHFHQRIFDLTPEEFEEDLRRSKETLEEIISEPIFGFRAPEWSIRNETPWALGIMKKMGLRYDSSMVPLTRMGERHFPVFPQRMETPFGNIIEFPLTTARCLWERLPYSGGLPLRIAPYCFVANNLLSTNKKNQPGMIYIHPWEFSNDNPKIDLPLRRRLMHYFRINSTQPKIEGLLKHFKFAPVREVLNKMRLW